MDERDDLWPPFGPAAAHRQQARRRQGQQPGQDRRRGAGRDWDRRSRSLSRAQIVDAAIAIADAEGAEAVSMRRIAQVLRAGAMSLYWHVAGKEHLVELMQDTLMSELTVAGPSGDWRADLHATARQLRALMLRHRWMVELLAGPALGPYTLRVTDASLAVLSGLDLDSQTAMTILQTVNTYVLGAVLRESQELREQREAERASEEEQRQIMAGLAVWRQRLAATGQYQHFLRMLADGVDPDAEQTREARFEFGLDCVLDGIAAKLAARPS